MSSYSLKRAGEKSQKQLAEQKDRQERATELAENREFREKADQETHVAVYPEPNTKKLWRISSIAQGLRKFCREAGISYDKSLTLESPLIVTYISQNRCRPAQPATSR